MGRKFHFLRHHFKNVNSAIKENISSLSDITKYIILYFLFLEQHMILLSIYFADTPVKRGRLPLLKREAQRIERK